MKNNKAASTARAVFSTLALIAFVLYMVLDKATLNESYRYTFGWRSGIFNDFFLLIPFLTLFVFAFLERELEHVNERRYIVSIFVLYLIQSVLSLFGDHLSRFDLFISYEVCYFEEVVYVIMAIRVLMLFLVPACKPIVLKAYSLGMAVFMAVLLIGSIYSARYWGDGAVLESCISLIPDILFHIALYFFGNLMTEENKTSLKTLGITGIVAMIENMFLSDDFDDWGFDDEDFLDEDSEEPKDSDKFIDVAKEYEKIVTYALVTESERFPVINHFFERLSRYVLTDEEGMYYPTEKYVENLSTLKSLVEKIQEEEPGYISKYFVCRVDRLLEEKEEEVFKMKVVITAREFLNIE